VVEEIIGRLSELTGAQIARLEYGLRHERQRRASAGGERMLPTTTRALRCPSRKSWSTAPTRTAICIVIVAALTGVIGGLGRPIAVLRKAFDKEYEQRLRPCM
jgi:hypothetical protein